MSPDPAPIRVVHTDAHPLLRMGVRALLADVSDLLHVGETDTEEDTYRLLGETNPDVLVLGLNLSGHRSLNVADHLLERTPTVHLVGLGDVSDPKIIYEMLALRAAAFVSKRDAPLHLVTAIRAAAAGAAGYFSPTVSEWLHRQENGTEEPGAKQAKPDLGLTRRELEVLRLVAKGHRNVQIGQSLFISPATVRNHLAHVFEKIGVNRRAEAVAWAWRHGLLDN